MSFDPHLALDYARAIARPRRVGSGEDAIIAHEIAGRLEQFGCQVERQPFEFSTAPTFLISLEVLACLLLILAAVGLREIGSWVAAWPAVLLLFFLVLIGPINRVVETSSLADPDGTASPWSALCLRLGSRYTTANLIATWPGLPDDLEIPHLYLVAHYDSKSQRISLPARIALFTVALTGGLIFAGLTLLAMALPTVTPAATAAGIVALLAGFPLVFLDLGNASPGALDNASGVGLALHLAGCLAQRPDLRERLPVTILITSAEEMTLMGAAAFLRENERSLHRQAEAGGLYILNLDGPGGDGRLYWAGGKSSRLARLIREVCCELGLPVGRFSLFGALFDHVPFARRRFDAVSLMTIGRASWAVHTPGDSVDKLHVRGFDQVGRVALRVMERL